MALYTEAAVRANLRNREGRRVFYLGQGDQLTPGARDFLRDNHIEILPASAARPQVYRTLQGAEFQEKPEHMTHLNGDVLVPKDHPRIVFRGWVDMLEAEILLAQRQAQDEGYGQVCRELGQALELVRLMIRCDVLNEPLQFPKLGGLDAKALRERSHNPQNYYNQPHFMPDHTQSRTLLAVNKARTMVRATELSCYAAFRDQNGLCVREDLLQGLNRLSSFLWIQEIQLAAGQYKKG